MWAYNVARILAERAGLKTVPDRALKLDREMLAAADAYLKTNSEDTCCIIKAHIPLHWNPKLKVIYITRDLRDQIFSLCRFLNRPLTPKAALEMVGLSMEMDAHYESWPTSQILRVAFDSLENDSANLIRRLGDFMGLPEIGADDVFDIDARFSKRQVKKNISRMDEQVFGSVEDMDTRSFSRVETPLGDVRAHDDNTGFQTGHVTDYQSGDWKHLWTDQQKKIVDDAIRIIRERMEISNGESDHQ